MQGSTCQKSCLPNNDRYPAERRESLCGHSSLPGIIEKMGGVMLGVTFQVSHCLVSHKLSDGWNARAVRVVGHDYSIPKKPCKLSFVCASENEVYQGGLRQLKIA